MLIYKEDQIPKKIINSAAIFSILILLYTLWRMNQAWETRDPTHIYYLIGFWAVVPPLWFWFEYFYLYLKYGKEDGLDRFKYGQQVAAAIWAGVLAMLIAFAASDVFPAPSNVTENAAEPAQSDTPTPVEQEQNQ